MTLLIISAAVTVFLLTMLGILAFGGREPTSERLATLTEQRKDAEPRDASAESGSGLGGAATAVTGVLKPIRDLILSSDDAVALRLTEAGFRRPEHVEVYVAAKMLLPIAAAVLATFAGSYMLTALLVGVLLGFFVPDIFVTQLISKRRDSIRLALSDAIDLIVICMEAGLGIDQALLRVGEEIRLTSKPLAEELAIINREQRAGKPRLDAWRSLANRIDLEDVRQFVTMLIQTERFGTPIANALGQFADTMRLKRTQEAEERAAKTTIKLLFPLVFFIFPSVFVVLLGPPILRIMQVLSDFAK